MPFYEIPASNYEIPTYAGIETPFYRIAEDTLLGPTVPVAIDATQTAIAYPHYFGTDFDGTYDSVNTPIMQEQQEAFRQAMADAAAAGNRGDYGLQAGYIWDAYNPGFAVLSQIGMLPRAVGHVISAGRAASRAMDGIAADSVQQTPTVMPVESNGPIDAYLDALERLGNANSVPTPTPSPVVPQQTNQGWLDSYLGMMDRVTNNAAQQPTRTIIPRSDRFITRYPRRPGLMSAEEAEQIQRAARLYPDL